MRTRLTNPKLAINLKQVTTCGLCHTFVNTLCNRYSTFIERYERNTQKYTTCFFNPLSTSCAVHWPSAQHCEVESVCPNKGVYGQLGTQNSMSHASTSFL